MQHIYAPLANTLGLGQIKWELEDIAFRYLKPVNYFNISKSLKIKRREREAIIESFKQELDILLKEKIQDFDISGRAKHIYSIAKKSNEKNRFLTKFMTPPRYEFWYQKLAIVTRFLAPYIAHGKISRTNSMTTLVTPNPMGINRFIRLSTLGITAVLRYKSVHTRCTMNRKRNRCSLEIQRATKKTGQAH